jgi:antitoxin MazE
MKTRVQMWGNSLAVRIPKSFAEEANLKRDGEIDMALHDGKVVLTPQVDEVPTLDELLAGVTADNIHPETDWGPAVGREVW